MAEYDESEYFTDSREEIAEREAQEALRRVVRTEIRRVQTGAADKDIADDIAREEEKRAMEEQKTKQPRWLVWINSVITGDILLAKEVERIYTLLTMLGVIFFASIATIFGSLQRDMRYRELEKEVALLKERAIRTSEECYRHSSHSAIVRKLAERNIEIEDPKTQPKILK
ncbi:MAG: hypothetical protein IKA04_09240 [Alistipes sp.]|nr:hypothetical protein [Alistipes sp.]